MVAGLLEPISVWRLDELSAGGGAADHAFVGRRRELRQFTAALEHSLESGQGETIIVRDEAGIGKTRLVEEFSNLAEAKGFIVHTGLVLDFGTAKGQDAIRALVRSLLGLPPDSNKVVRADAADRAVHGGALAEARRIHLNDLLDLQQPPDLNGLYQATDNATRNRGKQDTVGDLVRWAILARIGLMHLHYEEGLNEEILETAKITFDMSQEFGVGAFAGSALLHQSRAYLAMGRRDQAVEVAEDVWGRVIKNYFEKFIGPNTLAVIACSTPDEEHRNWAIDEGRRILSEGVVSHNHLFFHRFIMEAGMERGDWKLMQSACDALADFTRVEPLPLTDFFMARALALRDFYQGQDRDAAIASLHGLKVQAEQVGLKVALPRIETALSEAGH